LIIPIRFLTPLPMAILLAGLGCDALPSGPAGLDAPDVASAYRADPPVATRPALLVTPEWLLDRLSRPNVTVLHFGSPAAFAAAHIPGAVLIDLADVHSVRNGVPFMLRPPESLRALLEGMGVATSDHVVVYGDGPLQGARGFHVLEYVGHPHVSLLDGGLPGWTAAGGPTSTDPTLLGVAGRIATPADPRTLATVEEVLRALDDPKILLLDARPPTLFTAGHIPGARSLPWSGLVEYTGVPRLKPVPELRALLRAAGADGQVSVVAYCTSGMMSSVLYFVARYLGHDVRLYDGSYLEWTALDLPTEP
jgi:thiosulfate/3-mercaptopyruvate sulfurtransferase